MTTLEELVTLAGASLVSFAAGLVVSQSRVLRARRKMERSEQEMLEAHAELLAAQKEYGLLAERLWMLETGMVDGQSESSTDGVQETHPARVLPMRTRSA
jgi:hypothetical protein